MQRFLYCIVVLQGTLSACKGPECFLASFDAKGAEISMHNTKASNLSLVCAFIPEGGRWTDKIYKKSIGIPVKLVTLCRARH